MQGRSAGTDCHHHGRTWTHLRQCRPRNVQRHLRLQSELCGYLRAASHTLWDPCQWRHTRHCCPNSLLFCRCGCGLSHVCSVNAGQHHWRKCSADATGSSGRPQPAPLGPHPRGICCRKICRPARELGRRSSSLLNLILEPGLTSLNDWHIPST